MGQMFSTESWPEVRRFQFVLNLGGTLFLLFCLQIFHPGYLSRLEILVGSAFLVCPALVGKSIIFRFCRPYLPIGCHKFCFDSCTCLQGCSVQLVNRCPAMFVWQMVNCLAIGAVWIPAVTIARSGFGCLMIGASLGLQAT